MICYNDYSGTFDVLLNIVGEVHKRLELCFDSRDWIRDKATPQALVRESPELEAGDYAKVVVSTFQHSEEVRIGRLRGVSDTAIGEYYLKVQDVVANEAMLWREVRNAATKRETAYSD